MNRFPCEPWENRPSNDELDEREDRGFESEADRDLKQAVAYAKSFDVMLGKILGV